MAAQSTTLGCAIAPTTSRAKANENDALAQVPKNANKTKSACASKDVKGNVSDPPPVKAKFDDVVIKSNALSPDNRSTVPWPSALSYLPR